ncbi:DUF4172 domain-containing protein [Methylomicrobium sp. Wu6]|uniref:DUF4172 domain-containing protein n=1 Tax=Methylomicrobium sp. Wu6 TaxID=3107928 RepID=UPI002DD6B4D8|nr:DUF4172 domain-containing protein [Methylomicrobium sp. Wu6]MEC4747278.1 DUF4172 domain-containing protein [Methylomicrobium sp. Wu6]
MTRIWQQPEWPDFSYDKSRIQENEKRLLLGTGFRFGAFKHLDEEDKQQLTVELISNEVLKTSAIEGETLDLDSLQSSVRRQFGLVPTIEKSPCRTRHCGSDGRFRSSFRGTLVPYPAIRLASKLTQGHRDLTDIGRYRTPPEPM